jgi:hypothetical protein
LVRSNVLALDFISKLLIIDISLSQFHLNFLDEIEILHIYVKSHDLYRVCLDEKLWPNPYNGDVKISIEYHSMKILGLTHIMAA